MIQGDLVYSCKINEPCKYFLLWRFIYVNKACFYPFLHLNIQFVYPLQHSSVQFVLDV